jgi:hypothetical protein
VEVLKGKHLEVGICEVYYENGNELLYRTENFVKLHGECAKDVRADYDLILGAFSKPILNDKDFNYE